MANTLNANDLVEHITEFHGDTSALEENESAQTLGGTDAATVLNSTAPTPTDNAMKSQGKSTDGYHHPISPPLNPILGSNIPPVNEHSLIGLNRPYMSTIHPLEVATAKYPKNRIVNEAINASTYATERGDMGTTLLNMAAGNNRSSVDVVHLLFSMTVSSLQEDVESFSAANPLHCDFLAIQRLLATRLICSLAPNTGANAVSASWEPSASGKRATLIDASSDAGTFEVADSPELAALN
uniref:Uncharacterized protein n=1 Tax=Glossina pallidipes TaxID=7398 RepID=A0A1A9ZNY4_GLOPL